MSAVSNDNKGVVSVQTVGSQSNPPSAIGEIVSAALKKEEEKGGPQKKLLPDHINLSDEATLKTLVSKKYHAKKYFEHALRIARLFYEARPRQVSKSFGYNFSMDPEPLSYFMKLAKGETVVELAGACGQNGFLLAYAGAARVYVNDITHQEIVYFEEMRQQQPPEIGNKLQAVEGDCLKLLELQPQLESRVGLLISRNVIHFFNDAQTDAFFTLVQRTLKPGGRALISANSTYMNPNLNEIVTQNPDATAFVSRMCSLWNKARRDMGALQYLYQHFEPCSGEQLSTAYESSTLYTKQHDTKWEFHKEELEKVEEQYRGKVQAAIGKAMNKLNETPFGLVQYLKNQIRLYNKRTLEALVKRYGFIVELVFVVRNDGHLCEDARLNEWGQQVGVIIRAPDAPVAAAAAAAAAAPAQQQAPR